GHRAEQAAPAPTTAPASRAPGRPLAAAALVLWTTLIALAGAALTDSLTGATISGLPDPGPITRFSLPVVQAVRDVGALVTLGALLAIATCLPGVKDDERLRGPRARLLALSQLSALTWALTSLLLIALTYSDASGIRIGDPGFADGVLLFARSFDLGTYLVWGAGLATLIAIGATFVQRVGGTGWLLALSVAGLWTLALTGHAAGTANHEEAVNYQFIHLLGIGIWAGALAALAWVRRDLSAEHLATAVRRFSVLAAWSLAGVGISGVLGAALRIPRLSDLWTDYGVLVLLKVGALVLLGIAGWWHRRHLIGRLADGAPRAFARLVSAELVVLFAAAGLGVALNRSAPPAPVGAGSLSLAETELGRPFPPELTGSRWLTEWNIDVLFAPLTLLLVASYLLAVVRLRRRGDTWPWARTLAWVIGWLIFFWATSGAPAVYGRVLFSAHMVQHMTIAMAVPVFLVLGAPITLALRALPARRDGSRGIREWLLAIVHSRPAAVLTNPIVAAVIFVVGMMAFYYSPLFELSMRAHTGHVLMTFHFLLSGYVLVSCLIGTDPGIKRPSYPLRLLLMMVTFAFHAFFAIALMASDQILAEDWFAMFDRSWGESLADDQYRGASIGWAFGELPLAIIALSLLAGWVSSDRRERRRFDRNEDRTGDQELAAYNAFLQRIAEGTEGRGRSRESVVAETPGAEGSDTASEPR
ncbi:cytochrome c oxidase assembly protein, partial [Nocardioides dubius]|uniref:cytochrome c oxidase assembly protein n=1 Tax=Nocardioides dubius TaxID=317019 RepID=UPI0031D0F879